MGASRHDIDTRRGPSRRAGWTAVGSFPCDWAPGDWDMRFQRKLCQVSSQCSKRYSEEFKRDAVALVLSSSKTITEVARDVGGESGEPAGLGQA